MNRSGWTAEQIEARRQIEAAGIVPPYDVDDDASDDYDPGDDYYDMDAYMGGEDGGDPPSDAADRELLTSAPKRA
eukprot:4867165-Alexandrium_andersonii.AAC.1